MATEAAEATYPGLEAATLCEAFQTTADARAGHAALRTRGDRVVISWAEYAERVAMIAAGFAGLGVERGDTVGTMLTNRPEFHIVDMATAHLGAVSFGIYNTSPPHEIRHRLSNSQPRIVVTENAFLPVLRAGLREWDGDAVIVVVDGPAERALTLDDVAAAARPDFDFASSWQAIAPDDLLTLIYTSGTTGPPKGAQWSHGNVMTLLRNWTRVQPLPGRIVSYLPFAHAAERMMSHYMPAASGGTVTSCPDHRGVLEDIVESHPDFLVCVPRLWAKLKAAIREDIAAVQQPGLRGELEHAIAVGERRMALTEAEEPVPTDLREEHERGVRLLRRHVMGKYGLDRVSLSMIGGAPPQRDVQRFFHAAGLPLLEAYGQTEATFCITLPVSIDDFRIGTVGRPIPGLELKLAEDGEILLRGETIMQGYRGDPLATAAAFTADGWLRTGDIGAFDDGGRLKLVDRKKEMIINVWGKNMSPANIEAAIKSETPLIGQCVAIGNDRSYNVALLTLDSVELAMFLADHGLEIVDVAEAAAHPEVVAEIEAAVRRGNTRLARVEQVRRFVVLPVEWVPDSDELTPTAKVKRRNVAEKYAEEIERLYR
jgi:long-chain acyl-CoA synthetase